MNKKIEEIVDTIVKAVAAKEWAEVDRLQDVLEELVKIEVAAIEGKKS